MGLFTVPVTLSNPLDPERRLLVDLIVDTGAVYTMLPAPVVQELGLETPRERRVMLASGEGVTYRVGIVNLELQGEEWPTFFLKGPPGSLALLGAFTLEGFPLAPDPVNKRLVDPSRASRSLPHGGAPRRHGRVLFAATGRDRRAAGRRCATMKKKLPTFRTDREAEEFVEKADLTDYDLSGLRPVKLELEKKDVGPRMRALKKRAKRRARPTSKTRS